MDKYYIEKFPDMKGFSFSNLKYIKHWYLFYSKEIEKSQQAVGQISSQALLQSEAEYLDKKKFEKDRN